MADGVLAAPEVDDGAVTLSGTIGTAAPEGSLVHVLFAVLPGYDGDAPVSLGDADVDAVPVDIGPVPPTVRITGASTPRPEGAIAVDFDLGNLDQGLRRVGGAAPGKIYVVQLNIADAPQIDGWGARVAFDPRQLGYVHGSFVPSGFIVGLEPLVSAGVGQVNVGGNVLEGGGSGSGSATLGTFQVFVQPTFEGEAALSVVRTEWNPVDGPPVSEIVRSSASITSQVVAIVLPGDFDGNGAVEFADFFLFADGFHAGDLAFDLNGDEAVDFRDFFVFADNFGREGQAKLLALAEEMIGLPGLDQLQSGYPNPFNAFTTVTFRLAAPGGARLVAYTSAGQRVRMLAEGEFEAGYHAVDWNGRDDRGGEAASGLYVLRLETERGASSTKVLLLK
jgi:hypothetical protein